MARCDVLPRSIFPIAPPHCVSTLPRGRLFGESLKGAANPSVLVFVLSGPMYSRLVCTKVWARPRVFFPSGARGGKNSDIVINVAVGPLG
eukprot:574392-Pyramimonas_sp.AAC.1